jgi:hypothetical protein
MKKRMIKQLMSMERDSVNLHFSEIIELNVI